MHLSTVYFRRFFIFLFSLHLAAFAFGAGSPSKKSTVSAADREKEAIELYNSGTQLLFESNYEAAEKALKKALKKNKKLAEAHNNLAFALRKQGAKQFKQALKHYNTAIEIDSEIAEARMYRGVLYVAMGEEALAKNDLKWLQSNSQKLAVELEWVIENGKEKEPAQFFGVSQRI